MSKDSSIVHNFKLFLKGLISEHGSHLILHLIIYCIKLFRTRRNGIQYDLLVYD
jgi:hypothetical protein